MPSANHHQVTQVLGPSGDYSTRVFPPEPASLARAMQAAGNGEHGVWTATTFVPPSGHPPKEIFPEQKPAFNIISAGPIGTRFILDGYYVPPLVALKTMAIYTDGACSDNGASATDGNDRTPRGGCAFIFKPGPGGTVSFALEQEGPSGDVCRHTSNRAELRAAVAALQFREWGGEGWERLVLVTDSEYVGNHATGWLRKWAARGWRTSNNEPVKNQDLWKALSERIGRLAKQGCEIAFWTVPRKWNAEADAAAKAAVDKTSPEEFAPIMGIML